MQMTSLNLMDKMLAVRGKMYVHVQSDGQDVVKDTLAFLFMFNLISRSTFNSIVCRSPSYDFVATFNFVFAVLYRYERLGK